MPLDKEVHEDVYIKKRGKQTKREKRERLLKEKFLNELKPPVSAKTAVQKEFLSALQEYDVVVFVAPAGTGKTYLTMSVVSDWLKSGKIDKITITRPAIPMGRSLGLTPGTVVEKFSLFILPLLEVMWNRYGRNWYESCLSNGSISLLPPEHARGMSIDSIMVLDEAQGFHPEELYTMLTRLEEGGQLILIGDPNQTDIRGENGIDWLVRFVNKHKELQEHIKIIHATSDDIVRGGLCKALVKAKEKEGVID